MISKLIAWFDPQFARRRKKGHFSLTSYILYKWEHRKAKPKPQVTIWMYHAGLNRYIQVSPEKANSIIWEAYN